MLAPSIIVAVALCSVNAFASGSDLPDWAFPGEGASAAAPASPAAIVSLRGSRATYKQSVVDDGFSRSIGGQRPADMVAVGVSCAGR
jgi:hypothetical protein